MDECTVAGNLDAQYMLAQMLIKGLGGPADHERARCVPAVEWLLVSLDSAK